MIVYLNNKEVNIGKLTTVSELLAGQGLPTVNVAVAVNNKIVSRLEWGSRTLAEGDRVTVISAMYGG